MHILEPIFSFSNHPSLKGNPQSTIYCCPDRNNYIKFYYANYEELVEIRLNSLEYTSMGEPYRILVRLNFIKFNLVHEETIDISMEDAVRLFKYLQKHDIGVLVDVNLTSDKTFKKYLELNQD